LFQCVKGFLQPKNRSCRDVTALRRLHKDGFLEFAVEKGGNDVDLIAFKVEVVYQRKKD
jgi:hypothetical protein